MEHTIIHYFLTSNSAKGYVSFWTAAAKKLDKVIRLTGYPAEMMSALAEGAQNAAKEKGMSLELVHNPLDNSIEGLILPEKQTAVINTPLYLADQSCVFQLSSCPKLEEIRKKLKEAHSHFAEALKIHDEWEKIYISHLNFEALNELTEQTMVRLLASQQKDGTGKFTDRYFGAATWQGATDYIANITENIPKRYFIKGRPGTGKSTFLKKLARLAAAQGFDTEIYHCAFDPDSVDLITVRDLGLCLFDSTAPHEYFPSRPTDEIIDIYQAAVTPGTDEGYAKELSSISKQYKQKIASATECLAYAKTLQDHLNAQIVSELDNALCADTIAKLISDLFS